MMRRRHVPPWDRAGSALRIIGARGNFSGPEAAAAERPEVERGFQALRFNPYPVRAAVDIGTGDAVTLTVARVDARAAAIQDVLYHTSVRLALRWKDGGVLDPLCWPGVTNAVRMIVASGRSKGRFAELTTMLSLPAAGAEPAVALWRKETKCRLHFRAQPPHCAAVVTKLRTRMDPVITTGSPFWEGAGHDVSAHAATQRIAFAATAAVAKSLNPSSVLVLHETASSIDITGLERAFGGDDNVGDRPPRDGAVPPAGRRDSDYDEIDEHDSSFVRPQRSMPAQQHPLVPLHGYGNVLTASLPLNSVSAHAMMLQQVQRRPSAGPKASPNPCTKGEYATLRDMIHKEVERALPEWVLERLRLDAPIVAHGGNGSVWNIAARAARQTLASRDRVDMAALHQYAGLTDVLIGTNLPNPHLVVPQLALFTGLCAAMRTTRIDYLPDVALTHAMLVEDAFWAFGRQAYIREHADMSALQQSTHRTPRPSFDPHFDPDADRQAYAPDFRFDERQWKGGN
jgi:hypothetical protein